MLQLIKMFIIYRNYKNENNAHIIILTTDSIKIMLSSPRNSNLWLSMRLLDTEQTTNFHEDIVFDHPKSILEILQEYHPNTEINNKLERMIKSNNETNTDMLHGPMVFKSLRNFGTKDVSTVKVEYYGKLFFETWNLAPEYYNYISDIIDDKYREKCDKNKKNTVQQLRSWNELWDKKRYSKAQRKNDITHFIDDTIVDIELCDNEETYDFASD